MIMRFFKRSKNLRRGQRDDSEYAEKITELVDISGAINKEFYGMILGVQSPIVQDLSSFEKKVLTKIRLYLNQSNDQNSLIPRLPTIIPQLMSSLRTDENSLVVVDLVKKDATLVSEVIRLANSPYYRLHRKIDSIERAVSIIGLNGLRELVVRACLRPLLDLRSGHFVRISGTLLWDYAERCALLADYLASRSDIDRFHAYLIGIVQYTGYIVVLRIIDQYFTGIEVPRSLLFQKKLAQLVMWMTHKIAKEWMFPKEVLRVLKLQADESIINNLTDRLTQTIFVACEVAKESFLLERGISQQSKLPKVLPESLDCMQLLQQKLTHSGQV